MSRALRAALAALCAGAALLPAAPAAAFCRTTTCDPRLDDCETDAFCVSSGAPLSWPSPCVTFSVEEGGSARHGISADDAERVAAAAFAAWTSADCGGTSPSLAIEATRRARCENPEYNQDGGNANVLSFQDEDWPANSQHALALTTVWFNPDNGRIYDVDVEVNGTAGPITITTPDAGADLQSILTHEFGHFLGLSHSRDLGAVMRPAYDAGNDDLRALTADDAAGVCAIYPVAREITRSECGPRHGFSGECGGGASEGCALAAGAGSDAGSLRGGLFALGLGLTALFARSRRRRSLDRG